MSRYKNCQRIIRALFIFVLIAALVVVVGYFLITRAVKAEFGKPSVDLSPFQRLVIPVELFVNRRVLVEPQNIYGPEITFSIAEGESVPMICIRLEGEELIPSAELMRMYLIYTGLDRNLKSGQFLLSQQMSPVQIAAALLETSSGDAVISILPGWRIEEVAENVARSGLTVTAEEFVAAAYRPSLIDPAHLPINEIISLEGFLFPGTYQLPRESSLDDLLQMILETFNEKVDSNLEEGFARQGLSLVDAVNLASIIEKEAVVADEKPLITSVFLNRLEVGMKLETDPTIQYALGFNEETHSWWKSPLTLTDLTVNSSFNTYQNYGLPPSPICNPDLDSLKAVAFPADTPYYYFRATCDGSGRHNFAITYDEHLNNSCE